MPNKLKIIIVTYNATKWLEQCFSNFKILPENWEVIVIDNNSTDKTVEILKNNYPFVRIIETNSNLGFGKANNIGMKIALEEQCDNVLLLNQDAYITVDDIKKLQLIQNKNPDFYIVSPLHYNGTGSELDKNMAEYLKTTQGFINDAVIGNYRQEIYDCTYVNAACWMLSKECLETIGGFNPSFFLYGEDDNYLHRVLYHKKHIGIIPKVKVLHDRQFRPERKFFTNDLIRDWRCSVLIPVSNPSINKRKALKDARRFIVKKIKKGFLTFNYKIIQEYFYLLIDFYKKKKSMIANREKTEKIGAAFLV